MIKKTIIIRLFPILIFILSTLSIKGSFSLIDQNTLNEAVKSEKKYNGPVNKNLSEDVITLNNSLRLLINKGDTAGIRLVSENMIRTLRVNRIDSAVMCESYYLIGLSKFFIGKYSEAINWLKLSVATGESLRIYNEFYMKGLYNIAIAYFNLGDNTNMLEYLLKYIKIVENIYGASSPELASGYAALVTANIELLEYEKSINYGFMAMEILRNYENALTINELFALYLNVGVCYSRLADYSKAMLYFEKAESILDKNQIKPGRNYINLLNSMAVASSLLGFKERSDEYYEKGTLFAESINEYEAFNFINNYAIVSGNSGKKIKGEVLLSKLLVKVKKLYGINSRYYIEVLKYYADYLREFKIDLQKSLVLFTECVQYMENHEENELLKESITIGYAQSLAENGESMKALEKIQELLFRGIEGGSKYDLYENPDLSEIKADKRSLKIVKSKYEILRNIYERSNDIKILEAAASTNELLISVIEKVRINISEEESRLILGDRYRESYLIAIRDYNLCYEITKKSSFLEKAFKFSEKIKVAGLLASTRELKAVQFNIPPEIAELEKSLQREITLYNSLIAVENNKKLFKQVRISDLKEKLFIATQKRDSMIIIFEKKYPGYFSIKYNTEVVTLKEIPKILGRNGTYLNYVLSDTVLYIFIANRKNQQLLTFPVDSEFFSNIKEFRNLLSKPSLNENSLNSYIRYKELGNRFYNILIEPVLKYLISDKVVISPDNIISYLPFEIFLTNAHSGEEILYRELPYLMNKFRISYTYSATFLSESVKNSFSFTNRAIAFAPDYNDKFSIDSVMSNRQVGKGTLSDLPFAREEAEYVSDITGGKLYINKEAKESVYKRESGKFDIVHLAMHTILNDQYPMHSKMIFSLGNDSPDDGLLNTYEVYGIPLKAKMVVLSSCNTGTGFLSSGEGILSLARGFIYSGSQSVVMSMWEIEDKSGTEIIKMFYKNLGKGFTKSEALRKARMTYLKKSDQLRSHPYFWSTLVIYGNNAPLYFPMKFLLLALTVVFICAGLFILYSRKRKYS